MHAFGGKVYRFARTFRLAVIDAIYALGFLMPNKILSKSLYIVIAAVLIVALLGVAYFVLGVGSTISKVSSPALVVGNGDTVQVYYTGTLVNGTVFDSNVGKEPLEFTVGSNQVIPGFEDGIVGMKLNETKTITIPANEAYGQVNPALIINVPLSAFGNHSVSTGMEVSENTSNGKASGIVTAVNQTAATINFNPPLAGQTLIFSVKVVSIQKA